MKFNQDQYDIFLSIFGDNITLNKAEIGSLIYSSESSKNNLILLTKGSIRLIDNEKVFKSQTLGVFDAPFLIGFTNIVNLNIKGEVRANSECNYYILDIEGLSDEKLLQIFNLYKNKICYFELINLYKIIINQTDLKETFINNKYSFNDLNQLFQICTDISKIKKNDKIIYLDKTLRGFKYGQFINGEIYKKFFSDNHRRVSIVKFDERNLLGDTISEETSVDEKINKRIDSKENQKILNPNSVEEESKDVNKYSKSNENKNLEFELIKANNREESYFAIISMLVKYFDMPTRSETIRRASKIIEEQQKSWINNTVNLLDRFGLSVKIVRVNKKNPLLLSTPSIWINEEGICNLILKSNSKFVTLYCPLKGMSFLNAKQLNILFEKENNIITLEVGLNTPKNRFNLAWLIPYVQKFRTQLVEVFAASFLNQLFQLATPLLFQQIIDRVLSKGATEALTPLVVLMIIFSLLEIMFSSLRTFQFVEISNRIDIGIGSAILSRMLRLNARFFDSRPVGELSSRLNELENIRRFLTGTALTVVLDAIFSILYFTVMIFYSPLLTSIVFISVPLLFVVTVGVTPITQKLIRLRAEAQAKTNAFLVEMLGGIHTIKLQNAEYNARRQWEDKHLKSINQGFKAILANTTSTNAGQLINKLNNIAVIGIGSWLVINNQLTLGQLIAFRIISGYVTQPMLRLSGSWQQFQEMSLSLTRVGDIVNQPLEVLENEDKNIEMPEIKGSIKAVNVGFAYSSTANPVLHSVDIEIKRGAFVGLVGQSGCGKSSLLKMIPRLYRPTSGKLLIDDFDITKVDLYSLRRQIGFVPQDCMLFEGTVFSNIALGDPEISAEKVVEASKAACAHEFIMTLPFGYGTPIGEKGSGLSGGQRQRVALARMLLEKPNLVVLDEATSALDVDTEKQVVNNMREEFKDKTMLMITHRLSTIVDADNIIVMHNGRVDSSGGHVELMKQKGRYYALYNSQFNE
ncbi:MAG: ATP-binding cassette domain-containing protein [Flavobacteriales bacterium TMED191]|nr:MAG: ATP-binding cassette domain-containing protein [Flavobacteriales bacterium TMED191]